MSAQLTCDNSCVGGQDGEFTIEFEDGFVKQTWHKVVATLEEDYTPNPTDDYTDDVTGDAARNTADDVGENATDGATEETAQLPEFVTEQFDDIGQCEINDNGSWVKANLYKHKQQGYAVVWLSDSNEYEGMDGTYTLEDDDVLRDGDGDVVDMRLQAYQATQSEIDIDPSQHRATQLGAAKTIAESIEHVPPQCSIDETENAITSNGDFDFVEECVPTSPNLPQHTNLISQSATQIFKTAPLPTLSEVPAVVAIQIALDSSGSNSMLCSILTIILVYGILCCVLALLHL